MQNAYRAFRASIIEGFEPPRRPYFAYPFEEPHPLQQLRQQITAFREHLVFHGERILSQDLELEPLVRAALRIPADVPLLPTRAAKFCQHLMFALPVPIVVRRAKALLRGIGTHEGRSLVFALQIKRTLPGQHHFNPALDFALRELQAPNRFETFRDIHFFDVNWMQACHRLGVRRMDEVDRVVKAQSGRRVDGALVLALVDLGVIDTVDALARLPQRSGWRHGDDQLTQDDVRRFRQVVQQLKDAGVAPSGITRLVKLEVKHFDPQQLETTLSVLGLNGPDLSRLFEALGEQVMQVKPERWGFLSEALDVHSPADMERFKRLLDSGRTPSKEFALALRAAGAGIADLAASQSLILAVGDREGTPPPITELHQLIEAPHSLTFAQLATAEDYLLAGRDLAAYLRVLVRHGFGDAQGVLAFQRCYKQLGADTLDRWLGIAGERAKGQPATAIADWTVQAGKGGYVDSFDYLLQAGELRTFTHLQQALKLAPLGTSLLRYVREERGLKGLAALLKWYYHDAPGIKDVRLWGALNAVSRVLLDDAFERKDFTLLEGNLGSVRTVIDQRIESKLGRFPYSSDESTREAYHQSSRQMYEEIGGEIAPRLRTLLNESDGVLLLSLLEHIDSPLEVVRARLAQFMPELIKLRTGDGPAGQTVSDLEADLIAVVYRTTSSTVRNHWPRVIGREDDIAGLTDAPYSMNWNRTEQQLDGQLDSRGFQSIQEALRFAARFTARRKDMHEACRHLSPKRLNDPAADVWSLASHLGVLMAIAADDSNVREWLDQGAETIEQMAEAGPLVHQQIESLHELFDVQLGDALDVLEPGFVESLTEADAAVLASRLDMRAAGDGPSARDGLKAALLKARATVLGVFLRWTAQQKKRFDPKDVEGDRAQMLAYVSKSPAAFFAKEAAGICTRANTAMWQERRNAHLLVFAPDQKRLVGMALLYFERVPALDANRDTLVIRAINPMADALASYGVSSIVDSYFDVAIQIARNNGLAAVAFPSPMGMHLMSNHQTVENDIRDRFMKRAQSFFAWNVEKPSPRWLGQPRKVDATFYAYESGQTLVNDLYAVWHLEEDEQTSGAAGPSLAPSRSLAQQTCMPS